MSYRNLIRTTLFAAALPLAAQLPKPPSLPGLPKPSDPIEVLRKFMKIEPARMAALRSQVKAPEVDLPGALWVSRQANISPEVVIQARLGGLSWMDIFVKFKVPLERVVIVAEGARCGPFGRAWGWRGGRGRHGRREERPAPRPEFSDGEIADFIKLRAVSQIYGQPLDAVAVRFCGGHQIPEIIDEEDQQHQHGEHDEGGDEGDHGRGRHQNEKEKKQHHDNGGHGHGGHEGNDGHDENHGGEHGG